MRYFSVRAKSNQRDKSRFFIAVGVKTAKKAVKRNLLKRRAQGIILRNRAQLPKGKDFLIRFLPAAADLGKKELEKELLKVIYG